LWRLALIFCLLVWPALLLVLFRHLNSGPLAAASTVLPVLAEAAD